MRPTVSPSPNAFAGQLAPSRRRAPLAGAFRSPRHLQAAQPLGVAPPWKSRLGDTAEATLRIANRGNRDLVIQRIDVPAGEMWVSAAPGLTIPPGAQPELTARFAPRSLAPVPGPIHIVANDPAQPSLDILFDIDVRDLTFQTQLLAVAPELPLGEAATVVVTPGPQVHIEGGFVFFRARGSAVFADSSRLVRQGANFIALVPSNGITEAGLEYYVRVENSGVTRTDPPTAPADTRFYPVAPPGVAIANAVADSRDAFPELRPTLVVVSLPGGSRFVDGALYYRIGGATAWDSLGLEPAEISPGIVAPSATLPGDRVGARGVEFWARVRTLSRSLFDPPGAASGAYKTLRVTVDRLMEPSTHSPRRYRMVTVPLALDLPVTASLEALLSDQPEFGPPDITRWRAYRYLPSAGYVEIVAGSSDARLHPEPGRAFWLIASKANAIDTAPVPGRSTPTATAYPITLHHGWNQVGNPFLFPVAWNGVVAQGPSGPVTLEPPVAWDENRQQYGSADVTTLLPFGGYWVWNPVATPVELMVPAKEAFDAAAVSPPAGAPHGAASAWAARPSRAADGRWALAIDVTCGEHADTRNIAGVDPRASDGFDALDRTDPPMSPGGGMSLYFLDPNGFDRTMRTIDLRSPVANRGDPVSSGRRWVFDVMRTADQAASAEATLAFAGTAQIPSEVALRLVDHALGRAIDVRCDTSYRFVSTRRTPVDQTSDARFELLAGTAAYVAAATGATAGAGATRLMPVFPSPMSAAATIRFEIARAGLVRVEVFDVAGRRVRELLHEVRTPGRYELVWAGNDERGDPLAPGIYRVRMCAPERAEERRVVKLQ